MRPSIHWACALAVALASIAVSPLAAPQAGPADPPNEYEVKGAFLYNFAKFTSWPADAFANAGVPIVIGVVGPDPFGRTLDEMVAGERINGRDIAIVRLEPGGDLRACHILFISASERRRLADILARIDGASVLTVSDMTEFTAAGGMIRLAKQDYRVGLEVNLQATDRANLKISSRLLSLARIVATGSRPGVFP